MTDTAPDPNADLRPRTLRVILHVNLDALGLAENAWFTVEEFANGTWQTRSMRGPVWRKELDDAIVRTLDTIADEERPLALF